MSLTAPYLEVSSAITNLFYQSYFNIWGTCSKKNLNVYDAWFGFYGDFKNMYFWPAIRNIVAPNGLRERYLIIQSQQMIRSILRNCVKCCRITSRAMHLIMGNMPKGRTQLSQIEPSWTHVGVDLTGAIQLKKVGRRTVTLNKPTSCFTQDKTKGAFIWT